MLTICIQTMSVGFTVALSYSVRHLAGAPSLFLSAEKHVGEDVRMVLYL